MSHHHQSLQETIDALQKQGFRLTQARRLIVQTFIEAGGHLSADDLAAQVNAINPQVGRMTVYRTLEMLSEMGIVRPVYQGSGAAHYVFLHEGHHHHLVCNRCHTVIELHECLLGDIAKTIGQRFNFHLQGHLLEFFGLCADCHQTAAETLAAA